MGMAASLHEAQLAVFVTSLRQHSPPAESDIVLFMPLDPPKAFGMYTSRPPLSVHLRSLLFKLSVQLVFFDPAKLPHPSFHPSTYRWPLLSSFFAANRNRYGKVLVADVRDTLFQSDPFALVPSPPDLDAQTHPVLITAQENELIRDSLWNWQWIERCFGNAVMMDIRDKPVICSGVTIGNGPAVELYLRLMSSWVGSFGECEANGVDQGLHNFLIHGGELSRSLDSLLASSEGGDPVPPAAAAGGLFPPPTYRSDEQPYVAIGQCIKVYVSLTQPNQYPEPPTI